MIVIDIKKRIVETNRDERLKNRVGLVKMPYTLLYPTREGRLTDKGNSQGCLLHTIDQDGLSTHC